MQICGARLLAVALLFATPGGPAGAAAQEAQQVADTLAYASAFERTLPERQWSISSHRVSDAERIRVLRTLPAEGHVMPSAAEQQKLSPTRALLHAVHRSDIVIVVIDVPQAFIGLHGRVVLLISRPALGVLSAAELRAMAAHEVGHSVLWDEYQDARRNDADERLRMLELRCDALAALILQSQSLPLTPLVTGLGKLERFNSRMRATADANRYPPLALREQLAAALAGRLRPLIARLQRDP